MSRFFSEVFSELVPDGTGQLLMKSIADDVSGCFLCSVSNTSGVLVHWFSLVNSSLHIKNTFILFIYFLMHSTVVENEFQFFIK